MSIGHINSVYLQVIFQLPFNSKLPCKSTHLPFNSRKIARQNRNRFWPIMGVFLAKNGQKRHKKSHILSKRGKFSRCLYDTKMIPNFSQGFISDTEMIPNFKAFSYKNLLPKNPPLLKWQVLITICQCLVCSDYFSDT